MAIYSCQIKNISRKTGQSTTSKLSYITGEKVYEDRTGSIKNARHGKGGVVFCNTILPEGSPERYSDPAVLTNEFESYEKKSDARLGKMVVIALPREYSLDQNIDVVEDFIKNSFTSNRLPATYAIHDSDDGNPHAHVLVLGRALDKNGEWAKAKEKKVHVLDEAGNKIPLIDPETGQQKVRVRKGKGTEKLWKTKTVVHDPLNGRAGYKSIRQSWEKSVNKFLSQEQQVDCRSYKERGIELEPTHHEGYTARKMAKEGIVVDAIEKNKRIKERRSEIRMLDTKIEKLADELSGIEKAVNFWQEQLSHIKEAMSSLQKTVASFADRVAERISEFRQGEHYYNLTNGLRQDVAIFKYSNDTIQALDIYSGEISFAGNIILESDDEATGFIKENITGDYDVDPMTEEAADEYRDQFDSFVPSQDTSEPITGWINQISDTEIYREL